MKLNKIEEHMLQITSEVEKMMDSINEANVLFDKFVESTDFAYLNEVMSKINDIKALQNKIEKILS